MSKRQERALEVFLYVTFAIALFAGVGNTKSDTNIFPEKLKFYLGEAEVMLGHGQATNNDSYEDIQLQSRVSFVGNDDKINALDRSELLKHAKVLRTNPHLILNIIGHTSESGDNQVIGSIRAKHVYDLLVSYGSPKEQLIVDIGGLGSFYDDAQLEENHVELQYLSVSPAK